MQSIGRINLSLEFKPTLCCKGFCHLLSFSGEKLTFQTEVDTFILMLTS